MSNAATMLIATAPAKPARYLRRAHDRGLTIAKMDDLASGASGWTITSPNPIDDWQLWLYFTDGANGGRLTIRRYIPGHGKAKDKNHTVSRALAVVAIDEMGNSLDRHKARCANDRILTNLGSTKAAAPAVDTPDPAPVLAGLRANGRFALRAARHGHIQRNTPTKVVVALINRGLIQAGGYVLTDLGRAVRNQMVGA